MMSSTLWRSVSCLARRSVSLTTVRCGSGLPSKPVDQHAGKYPDDNCQMPDSYGHSVGVERYELLQKAAGNEDPFQLRPIKRSKGTFEEPTVIASPNEKRMVGCVCEEDALTINWMNLYKGEAKRCECGYWFKLVDEPAH